MGEAISFSFPLDVGRIGSDGVVETVHIQGEHSVDKNRELEIQNEF